MLSESLNLSRAVESSLHDAEFDYINMQLSEPYCGPLLPAPSPPASPPKIMSSCLPSLLYTTNSSDLQQTSYLDCTSHYENDLVSLDRVSTYEDEIKYADMKYEDLSYEDMLTETSCSPDILSDTSPVQSTGDLSAGECSPLQQLEVSTYRDDASPSPEENNYVGKGKVNELQRTALDAIFDVTSRPSRVLVLHIAAELQLHHVTVKNFFSNARRRVRRAAARLSDPERSRRENRRRKEKRRLAALAAAAAADGQFSVDSCNLTVTQKTQPGELSNRETTIISPQRRALMEKLADKVQRSAAQRNLAAMPPDFSSTNCSGRNAINNSITSNSSTSSSSSCTPPSCSTDLSQVSWPQSLLNETLGYQPEPWDLQLF